MINTLGKSLVCVQLVLSTLFLAFAIATYAQMTDFGWQKPREEFGQQIASEYDKHAAALQLALQAKARAEAALQAAETPVAEPGQPAQKSIAEAMLHRHGNYLFYLAEIEKLRHDPNNIEVRPLLFDKTAIVVDQAGKAQLDKQAKLKVGDTEASKSQAGYHAELLVVVKKLEEVNKDIQALIVEQQKITDNLGGERKDGKDLKPGLYSLLERESVQQRKLKEEIDHIKPLWVRELVDAQLLTERRLQLEKRRDELRAKLPKSTS